MGSGNLSPLRQRDQFELTDAAAQKVRREPACARDLDGPTCVGPRQASLDLALGPLMIGSCDTVLADIRAADAAKRMEARCVVWSLRRSGR
jgi:hypothetical protein